MLFKYLYKTSHNEIVMKSWLLISKYKDFIILQNHNVYNYAILIKKNIYIIFPFIYLFFDSVKSKKSKVCYKCFHF